MKKRGWMLYRSFNPNPRGVRKGNSAEIFRLCKLEFGVASCLNSLIGIWHIGYFFFTFCPAIIWNWETSLEDWKMLIRWCRTDIYSCKLSEKVSLMLSNPFLVLSLCKLNHINIVKGHGIIYTNDVIKKLIYNIKNVRKCTLHKFATFSAVLLPYCIYC